MRAAVIGGGVFGATAAIELARAGHDVDLYERHPDLLHGGSGNSCGRLHRGYHYPRSEPTARATMQAADRFVRAFPTAIHRTARHHYLIAADSKVPGRDYLEFLDRLRLPYQRIPWDTVDYAVLAHEELINVGRLRAELHRQLSAAPVRLLLGYEGGPGMTGYDLTVLATYGAHTARELQFEVTEVAVVALPAGYALHSYVILDGAYCCLDPLPGTAYHLLYDVVHSVHHTNIGYRAEIPGHLAGLVDAGVVDSRHSRYERMVDTARRFFPLFTGEHVGSMYTVRAVLPNVDATDERPTIVERDGNTISILSGKIDTAVAAARQIVGELVPA